MPATLRRFLALILALAFAANGILAAAAPAQAGPIGIRRALLNVPPPAWVLRVGGSLPVSYADATTEGVRNHYWYRGAKYNSFAAWLAAAGGSYSGGQIGSNGKFVANASSVLTQLSAGALPFNYDGSGNPLGLLLEGASTNIALQSNNPVSGGSVWKDWNTASGTFSSVSTSQNATGPDGTTSAWTVTDTSANSYHGLYQSETISASTNYALSVWLKAGTASYAAIGLNSGGSELSFTFNFSNGTITTKATGPFTLASSLVTAYSNGWYRVSIVGQSSGTSANVVAAFTNSSSGGILQSFTGSASDTFEIFGFQFEAGAGASSYIPTTSSTASRAADSLTLPWTATTATFRIKTSNVTGPFGNDFITIGGNSPLSPYSSSQVDTGNGSQTLNTSIAGGFAASHIMVAGGNPSARVISADGAAAASDSNAFLSGTPATLYIGGGSYPVNGDYAQFGAWAVAATAAQAAVLSGTP